MRDDRIYQMHEANVKRVMLLLRQLEFLQTRQRAYEEILATPWSRIKAIFDPAGLKRLVDNRQKELLAKADREMTEAMAKPVVKPVTLARA